MKHKKIIFPIILLIVCWIFNLFDCILSSSLEINFKNIVTLKSFAFTCIVTLLIYYCYENKK